MRSLQTLGEAPVRNPTRSPAFRPPGQACHCRQVGTLV